MTFIIPWIFRAGTKAKSAEVNENFLAVKQFVDLLEDDIATNQISVQTLEDTKANINGNPTERFQVANAIVGNDAVNLNILERNTQNSRGFIEGYNLNFTNKEITASKGTCYSFNPNTNEYEYLIKSTIATKTGTLSLASNTTQYIYICGYSTGTGTPKLVVSSNSTTPSLPTGTDCFRRLGYLLTDGDGNIKGVYKDGEKPLPNRVGFITSYLGTIASAVSTREYTAEQNLYLYIRETGENNDIKVKINLGGTWREVGSIASGGVDDTDSTSLLIPIAKGQKYQIVCIRGTNWVCYKYGMGG